MRKSNKCEYTIGVNKKKKRKYLKPEEALAEAARLNSLDHVIKKCVAYKCTTCHFFHVGRTSEDIDHGPLTIPYQEPEEIIHAETIILESKIIQEDKIPIKESVSKKNIESAHDEFDWDSDRRII